MSKPEYERPQYFKAEVEPVIGMLGWSAEAIAQDAEGYCWVPIGPKDTTFLYGRVWIKRRFTALEPVRANRDIIIATETLQVKEHTPSEISYELAAGGYQRVTENYPLPITGGSRAITHVTLPATAAGTTLIIAPTVATRRIRVHYFSMSNRHAAAADVALTFDSTGAVGNLRHRHFLAGNGGNINANLIDANWEGAAGQPLYAYLAAAYTGGVYFNIGYSEV